MTEPTDFATATRSVLRMRGWSDAEFSRKLDKSPGSVSEWLSGKHRPPLKIVALMEDVLGLERGSLARYLATENTIIISNEQSGEDKVIEGLVQLGVDAEYQSIIIDIIRKAQKRSGAE